MNNTFEPIERFPTMEEIGTDSGLQWYSTSPS